MKKIFSVLSFFLFINLQTTAQCFLRTNSVAEISGFSLGAENFDLGYVDRFSLEESFYYRKGYNKDCKEKTMYNIFSLYMRNQVFGLCPYGLDFDVLSERSEKSRGNTFRYWNKIRMGFKLLVEVNPKISALSPIDFLDGEIYFSYLHLPHGARGDQTTKARKGSFHFFILATPSQRGLAYMKFNVGSVWIKTYYRQGKFNFREFEYTTGLTTEIEINKNGYNRSLVSSSRDVYRGITLIFGTEYNIKWNRVFANFGIMITTENH